jgi:rare lipoprotein A
MRRPAGRGESVLLRPWLVAAVGVICLTAVPAMAADPAPQRQVGKASWYGHQHGRPTANGERFDRADLTAAHPTLPMNSLVRVTNLSNGRSVVLRINDRGPTTRGRVIDVSQAAAEMLGMKGRGVATVKIEPITD